MRSVDFEDFLESEVFDEGGQLIGILECFWTDEDDQAEFLGIKRKVLPDQISVAPARIATTDERHSCIRIQAPANRVADAPALDCDEDLEQRVEEQVYIHFRLSAPAKRHELHVTRARSD